MSSFWHDRTVCVTGGSGFLGYHMVLRLLDQGARVRVLALPPRPGHPILSRSDVEFFWGDLLDPAHVQRALAGCQMVFHTAGTVAVWGPALARMRAIHEQGTRNVLDAAPEDARIVHTSSIVAVGASRGTEPLDEESPFELNGLKVDYVHAKRASEEIALRSGRDVVVVNPGYLVGPEDHEGSVMGRFCVRFWKGRMVAAPHGGFNLVDVRDVAEGHLLAAERGRPRRRYILGGENRSLGDFMDLLARAAGFRPRLLPRLPNWILTAVAAVAEMRSSLVSREPYPGLQQVRMNRFNWFYRSDRAQREIGYRARPLEETVHETFRWYADRGRLSMRGFNRWWMRPAR